jgi:hypothetical protein
LVELNTYFYRLNERDLSILQDLYNFRALTTEQIKRKYFPDSEHYVNKILYKLRKENFIISSTLRGSRDKRKGVSYHRLTETGLECLARHGVSVEGYSQNLYLKPSQLHYVLSANDIMTDLTQSGWEALDSRGIKKRFNLDDRMNIHGLLIEPEGKHYGYYVLEEGITRANLGKMVAEIRDSYAVVENFIIFTKGSRSYNQFINFALNPPLKRIENHYIPQQPLYTGYDLKIVNFAIGRQLYKAYPTSKQWLKALASYYKFEIISEQKTENRQSFDTIIRYKGEEMYFVDLTDTDLTKIRAIKSYTQHHYNEENKRKILVANFLKSQWDLIREREKFLERLVITKNDFNHLFGVVDETQEIEPQMNKINM